MPNPDRRHSPIGYIPSLDGIRAVSIGLVFLAHAGYNSVVPTAFGVTVFFVLSGYLITTLLRVEIERTGDVSLRAFYLRRALRIFPPMYAVLIGAYLLALSGAFPTAVSWEGALAQTFHLTNVWAIARPNVAFAPGTGVYWSLAVEEHFYLLYPLLFLAYMRAPHRGRRRRLAMVLVYACAAVLLWRIALVALLQAPTVHTYEGTDARIDSILIGCILGLVGNPARDPRRLDERFRIPFLAVAASIFALSLAMRADFWRETTRYTLQSLCVVPVLIIAVRYPSWGPMRLLNLAPVRFLGVLSYSLYLVHYTVLSTVRLHAPTLGRAPTALVALTISLAIAYAIHLVLEQPAARLRRRLHERATTVTAPSAAIAA